MVAREETLNMKEKNCQTKLLFEDELSKINNGHHLRFTEKINKLPICIKKAEQFERSDKNIENVKDHIDCKPDINLSDDNLKLDESSIEQESKSTVFRNHQYGNESISHSTDVSIKL